MLSGLRYTLLLGLLHYNCRWRGLLHGLLQGCCIKRLLLEVTKRITKRAIGFVLEGGYKIFRRVFIWQAARFEGRFGDSMGSCAFGVPAAQYCDKTAR